jgi:hypothetical protein
MYGLLDDGKFDVTMVRSVVGPENLHTFIVEAGGMEKLRYVYPNGVMTLVKRVQAAAQGKSDTKVCAVCEHELPTSEFYPGHGKCKQCYNEMRYGQKTDKLSKFYEYIDDTNEVYTERVDKLLQSYNEKFEELQEQFTARIRKLQQKHNDDLEDIYTKLKKLLEVD